MELKLEVVLSSSIKRKKPWPRFCWLGQEKESVFLLDDKRISEINMVSGRTKKRTPKLHPLLNSVVTMASSHNGIWLCGLLVSGELFLWNRDKDLLKTAAAALETVHIITSQGSATRLSLQVSGNGMRVLLVAITGQVFLWECLDVRDLTGVRDGTVKGQWSHIQPLEDTILPSSQDKEASQHTIFVKTEVLGDACLSAFVFTSGKNLIITCLKVQWEEGHMRVGCMGYSVQWATKTYPMSCLTPPCQPVKSRGALVPAFSPDGKLLAVVLNQRQPKATQVLFVSTQNFVSISSSLGGCGSKKMEIPSKYIRSYWVGSVSWSPSGLFLACVLKRGSLLMLARLGGLLTLTSSGCNIDLGPAQFLPLHPLVTYRPPLSAGRGEASLSSSSLSVRDVLRQRYSVTWHPRLLYLIVSDGYMATVMRVLDRPSPALLLKTLLKDTSKDLEKASRILDKSQIHVRAWLESVSCLNLDSSLEVLNATVTCGPNTSASVFSAATDRSTLPIFLQDKGTLAGTKELLEKMQTFFEDDSDLDGPPAGSHVEDGGRLEFASMFDTLHAQDTHNDTEFVTGPDYEKDFVETERKTPLLHHELGKIQSKLLTAWAFSMSLGNAVEHRAHLLKHTLYCVVRFAALLHLIPKDHTGRKNTSVSASLLHLIKAVLYFLPWDSTHSDGPCCLGLVVEFSKRLVRLLLTPHPESYQTGHCQLSSQNLSTTLHILQLVSDSLDHTYSLQLRTVWSSAERDSPSQPPQLWPSDVHYVPLLQEEKEKTLGSLNQAQPVPQRPSSRLFGVWQWVYQVTQQYLEELNSFKGCDGWEEEQQQLSFIMSQIQTALQATGERLEEGPALLSYPGEHLFLFGLYPKSADAWQAQICDETNKIGCDRSVFQEVRICLALLYSLLSQYRLREAQELGDHMAHLILHRAGHQRDNMACITDSLPCPWLPMDLHSDTACAVVQSLGRFMASYFTNQPLHILPPHNVAVLPPLHLPHAPNVGRLVPLGQEEVATAVRRQQLSEVWTVEYAQDLLLLGGLLPEAVWLAYHLGDWKTAVSLSLAYSSYCTDHLDFAGLRRKELHLPTVLEAESIFQAELECLLGHKSDSQDHRDREGDKSFTDPLEGEDWDLLQVSIQEILKASVVAGVNVMSSPLSSLLDKAKDLCSCLPMLVPNGLYLPSPPLYCPQPSPNTQDPIGTVGQFAEVASRHKVSGVLQRLLLLLRSARCCHPAAQWYITHLRRARHLLHKIKKKYSYPAAAEEERAFPEGLMKFVTRSGFFKRGPNKDGHLDSDTIQTIICFRELCGLCWMLHVRDRLSISCRKYQAARQHGRDEQIPVDSEVRASCIDALHWACRFLPFSRFLNAEEILQDILLSLVSELPPVSLVADTLVRAFPEEEESVRVPLREKYNSVLQRVRQCNVLEEEEEEVNELMMILIQDKHRQRRKHLGRLRRHLGPPELHLWEKEEEEDDRGGKHGMAILRQLSLGTSLSTSTLTDCGFPPVCSDGDTTENTSEAISPEQHCQPMTRDKKAKRVRDKEYAKKTAVKIESAIQEEVQPDDDKGNEKFSLPVVGTWEFELEDEEYLNFLELFLSYVLEKDSADGGDSGSELPLLKGFSSQLRERELHSLTFDVLTTIHRRQRDGHHTGRKHWSNDPPVFRAGCCYKPIKQGATPEPQTSSIWSEAPLSRAILSVSSLPGLRTGRQKGLFGLRQQSSVPLTQRMKGGHSGSETSPFQSAFPMRQPSESFIFGSSTSVEAVNELQQGLDPKLEAQFPELGRLLEWMVRWADRRVLLGHHGKKKKERGGGDGGTADEGVVIRVKASAPAVLTSLSLLEWRYTALLTSDHYSAHIQVPETQWTVAPVLQPEVDRKLERESSVDTGYPGSANTPITGLDHNVQQGELSIGSCTDDPEELTCHRMPPPNDQDQLSFAAQQRCSSSQKPSLCDLDVTPEKEGKSSDSEGLEVSSSVSHGHISENICTPERSLKLADLDVSEKAEDMSSSISLNLQAPPHPEPQALLIVQPEASVHTEHSDSTGVQLPNTPIDPPSLQPQSSTAGAPTAFSTAPSQPTSSQTPPMRQRLGEDLFRLVQNINYMSLMEVLGASFSNLQLAQQSSSLAQSNMNSSHPNVPSSHVTNFIPEPNPLPVQTAISVSQQTQASVPNSGFKNPHFSQAAACLFADQPAEQSLGKIYPTAGQFQITRNLPSTTSGAGVNYQEMQPLSVQAESPEIQFIQSKRLIPSSQGLLATTHASHTVPSSPVVLPSNGSIQKDPASQVSGLKLLQLQRPPLPQQSAPHYPPARGPQTLHTAYPATLETHQPKLKHNHQAASKRKEEEKRNGSSVPRRQLSFNHPHDPSPWNSQPQIQTSERSRGQEFSFLPPALPAHTPAPMQGLRLLHFQPVSHSNITFPKLPCPSSSRPSTVITAPMGETPLIKLLHIESGPKMILPLATPSNQMTRLMSMEELTSSVIRRQNAEEAQLQLLRVDPPTENPRAATTSPSSKRQRRREVKERRERKTEVTFRPNESIIPVREPADGPINEEPTVAEKITPGHDFAIPLGSFDSLLTGQRLLDKAMSTSAELHAFASICKRPPECHDAFTNTDPTSTPTRVDKAVSASVTTSSPKSQSSQNFQVCTEHPVQDTGETPKKAEKILGLHGHQFISVLDLEDEALHHDLPLCLSPETQDIPPIRPSSPTSAELHVLATSVIRSGSAAADPQPSSLITDNFLKPTNHPEIPEDTPLLRYIEPSTYPERITPQDMADPSDSEICQAIRTQSVGPHRASSSPPAVWFSSRLSEMDAQLAALQNIADHLEMDFSNSRMLVNTIETLTPVLAPDVKSTMAVKKTVRLSVPREAWTPRSDILMEPKACEEEEENQQDKYVHRDSRTPERKPTFRYLTSPHSHTAGLSYLHTPPKMTDQLSEASGISHVWEDENLGHTGLSDTAEILDELVKEGYLSPTDLNMSTSHAAHYSSRLGEQQSSWMSQRSVLPEDERRELRIWMRRKQRERLAVYQKHRESLRQREHKPFTASAKVKSTNRNQATIWETREEKEKFMLLEQYNQRTREACSLASDFPTSTQILRSSSQPEGPPLPSITRSTSTPPCGSRPYSAPANDKRSLKSQSGQTQPRLCPWTAEVQARPSEDHSRRLGLHRPVTSLPRDRLSQVTRRGMLSDTKSHTKLFTENPSEERHVGYQRKTHLNKSPSRGPAVGRGIQREGTKVEDREEVNLWEPTSEVNRLLDLEESESNIVLARLLDEQDGGARAGVSGMDWLDNLSESASSSLSKIDWAAIERMVAGEEA
ncbi:ciliogenesis and planar polarity effector 1 isoform X1 [Seriola aureovittata]|uniref:ciliogenesis and planar polarity effector 1 isoform X1 n=1 Tax=Seriola aureovittata TaxID=2871759 RepID=UPI0024BEF4FF|nr:ciliogenesis and planar polarity effector 1 isoform X1 [Seriola aureovittata]XP_056260196.1 ciliogenesis and planar polarity effector 1 isoform X1 [Seriola aureovittata]XP_056260197.1 ciliogenesis and planar polarity effector 1 isoform X1 [Seriola aureovittata]